MEIKDDITRKKIELTIKILQAALQGKDIEYNSTDNGWNKTKNLLAICPAIIDCCRIANNYRPCATKQEFIQLIEQHSDNLIIKNSDTEYSYVIIGIYETYVVLRKMYISEIKHFTFKELFDNFMFNNDKDYIIGIKINDEKE